MIIKTILAAILSIYCIVCQVFRISRELLVASFLLLGHCIANSSKLFSVPHSVLKWFIIFYLKSNANKWQTRLLSSLSKLLFALMKPTAKNFIWHTIMPILWFKPRQIAVSITLQYVALCILFAKIRKERQVCT